MPRLPWLHSFLYGRRKPRVVLGTQGWFGRSPIYLDLDTFDSHIYAVGASGNGKSKFLQHLLCQLVTTSWGCGVIDPHGDLTMDTLAQLASYPTPAWLSAHYQRVIYLDPSRTDYLLPGNLLKNSWGPPHAITNQVIEAFRRVWPQTLAEAPRFAQIMRCALLTLMANDLTLLELEPLLTDRPFRQRLLNQVTDPTVVSFFSHQFDRWGREQAIFVASVLNKVSAFLFQPSVRLMFGANDNVLDLRRILDEGILLIVNLGMIQDEETRQLVGSLLLTAFEQAAKSRSTVLPSQRKPYLLLVDEFASFSQTDPIAFAKILSECRKHRLYLGLAHQTITQLLNDRIHGALENAKLKIVFGTGRQTAESIVKELFRPDLQSVKHEVDDETAQARTHPLFDSLSEQFERFTQQINDQQEQQIMVKLPGRKTVIHARTPRVPPARIKAETVEQWKRYLLRQHGKSCAELTAEIAARTHRLGLDPLRAQACAHPVHEAVMWQ